MFCNLGFYTFVALKPHSILVEERINVYLEMAALPELRCLKKEEEGVAIKVFSCDLNLIPLEIISSGLPSLPWGMFSKYLLKVIVCNDG